MSKFNVRFSKTKNVNYQCVYDSDTAVEYFEMYDMVDDLNKIDIERQKLKNQNEEMLKWLNKVYGNYDGDDVNDFNRFVEKLRGIESTGIVFGGVLF